MESCEKSVSEGIQKEDVTLEPIGQPIVEKMMMLRKMQQNVGCLSMQK